MRFTKILFVTTLLTLLTASCNGNNEKVSLNYGSYVSNELTKINQSELASKVDNKESFLIVVSPSHEGCMCWVDFKKILLDYITNNHLIIYEISYNSFFDTSNNQLNTFSLDIRKEMETFAIFSSGELKVQNVYSSSNSIFKQPTAFKEYLESMVTKPIMYYISLDQLNQIYTSKKEAVIYFARNNCPDCQVVDKEVLFSYSKAHTNSKQLYILDCENIGIREYDENGSLTTISQAKWQEFKDNYGLSKLNNETFGYGQGYVPTFQLIKGNDTSYATSIVSSSVFFNDTLSKVDNVVKVTESFYSSVRVNKLQYTSNVTNKVLEGLTISENDYSEIKYNDVTYYTWKPTSALNYHNPLLTAFLDYALPQVSHSF